jgi:hypothetical protein
MVEKGRVLTFQHFSGGIPKKYCRTLKQKGVEEEANSAIYIFIYI